MTNTNFNRLVVLFKDQPIGLLVYDGSNYEFEYTEEFSTMNLQPLPGITPPKSRSEILWSYFQSRIPAVNTPVYLRLIEKYNLNPEEKNLMRLLATVGSEVATDPFIVKNCISG